MFKKVKVENLPVYLSKIERIFPEFTSDATVGISDVNAYYRESFWGYALFHSWAGAIHMALSEGGEFSKNDYFRQAEEVEQVLAALDGAPMRVLEVGCGRGFNIAYLANRFPQVEFSGIDLSAQNVDSARKALSSIKNAKVEIGNFHSLEQFGDSYFDLVFAIETLCHSNEIDAALKSIGRVLRKGGALVVFDGFRNPGSAHTELAGRAVTYTERAMAVPEFQTVDRFVKGAEKARLALDYKQDRSAEIMPNLVRLSDFAKAFFKIEIFSRLILWILPRGLVTNAVAGLLMAVTVQMGAHQYIKLVFGKAG